MTESEGKPAIRPGRTAERVGVFTDAVFAIAMTLLVIEIPRPEAEDSDPGNRVSKSEAVHRLWHFLAQQQSAFYAYLLAFCLIWVVWRQHHRLFGQIHHVSAGMVALHFPLLLQIPWFLTGLVGNLTHRIYRGGGWPRLRIRPS